MHDIGRNHDRACFANYLHYVRVGPMADTRRSAILLLACLTDRRPSHERLHDRLVSRQWRPKCTSECHRQWLLLWCLLGHRQENTGWDNTRAGLAP
eukprot:6190301-Prymnesium_polylepis.1